MSSDVTDDPNQADAGTTPVGTATEPDASDVVEVTSPEAPSGGAGATGEPEPAAEPAVDTRGLAADAAAAEWGRITVEGDVFVRDTAGERHIGSWQAGSPQEGLAFYERRYEDLLAEVALLERRLATDADDITHLRKTGRHLAEQLVDAAALGDLGTLRERVKVVDQHAVNRAAAQQSQRAAEGKVALAAKEALVLEAEKLTTSTEWKATGDRLRAIVEEWKVLRGSDKKAENALWRRLSTARSEFTKHRSAHFAALDEQRTVSAARKEALAVEAEKLVDSPDFAPTASRYKQLMSDWKAAGRAARDVDDALWLRFRTAQDTFFSRRNSVFAERDAEFEGNQEVKEALLVEAEALDPGKDLDSATAALRALQEKWESAGKVPRQAVRALEERMEDVEDRFREASETRWRKTTTSTSPLVIRLQESVSKLESRLARAEAAGDAATVAKTIDALQTQRGWLAQAERS